MRASQQAWFNGTVGETAKADPSVASNTLHLGIAVFDGIMAYRNGSRWYVHRRDEHLDRFLTGSARMELDVPWQLADLTAGIDELLDTLPPRTHYLRPIAYRTGPEVFFQVEEDTSAVCVFAVPVGRDADAPYRCQLSPVRRVHHRSIPATWKVSGAYANSWLAEREARAAGADTGLMLDYRGRIAEASASNVFFVAGETLITPKLDGDVFPGITRAVVLECAAALGIEAVERDVWPFELDRFDAAFVSGTLCELRALDRIDGYVYGSTGHHVYRRLLAAFRDITHQ
jgi:branched-chain amino acid aminotransferase